MAQFVAGQVLGSGDMAFPNGIRDLFVWASPSGPVLYAATLNGGGIGAFAVTADGTLGALGSIAYDGLLPAGITPDMTVATVGTGPALIVSGTAQRALPLGNDGRPVDWVDPGGWTGTLAYAETVSLWGGERVLTGGTVTAALTMGGGYILSALVPGVAAGGFAQAADGGLFAIAPGSDAIVRLVPGAFGALLPGQVAGALDGLGWNMPSSVVAVEAGGVSYIVVAAAGSSSLTVLSFDGSTFRIHDHVIDDRGTRFDGVLDLSAVTVNGRTLIAAGGGDEGVSLFGLLGNGRLVHVQTIVDTVSLTLSNVAAVSLARAGSAIQLVAASEGDPGLTVLTRPAATLAAPLIGGVGADVLAGGSADDLIEGGAGDDRLSGGAGDDILHDGDGSDVMRGGPGADIFVLASDGRTDRIEDFDPRQDRLDLSLWPGLYAVSDLAVVPTGTGAVVTFGDERLEIVTASGAPLDPGALTEANAIGLTRVPLAPIGRDLSGGPGPDALTGASGSDRIVGLEGDDTLSGLDGNDLLAGGPGDDTVAGDGGRDRASGGAGGDAVSGGPGGDVLMGGPDDDTVDGGDGPDMISGGGGDDVLMGAEGNDVLRGGAGSDTLSGGSGADRLSGGTGDDRLSGDAGDDFLDGGAGGDVLTGGPGADVFVFRDGAGSDVIADFESGAGDRVDLSGLSGLRDWGAVSAVLADGPDGAVLDAGGGDVLVFAGLAVGTLGADDFWF